jgi:hypothetical protein
MNLARATPLASSGATLLFAFGLCGPWVRNGPPRPSASTRRRNKSGGPRSVRCRVALFVLATFLVADRRRLGTRSRRSSRSWPPSKSSSRGWDRSEPRRATNRQTPSERWSLPWAARRVLCSLSSPSRRFGEHDRSMPHARRVGAILPRWTLEVPASRAEVGQTREEGQREASEGFRPPNPFGGDTPPP